MDFRGPRSSMPAAEGTRLFVQLTAIAVFFGLSLVRLQAWPAFLGAARYIAAVYIDFIRGTPLLVQTFIVFYGLPGLIGQPIPAYWAAVLALSINSGAYVAEIVRSGIQSIDKGQGEAAVSLGMTGAQTMRHIIIPQAFSRIIPPLGNEFIALLKDSSLVSVIALEELVRKGQIIIGRTFRPFEVWLAVALIYLAMTFAVSRLVSIAEKRMKTDA